MAWAVLRIDGSVYDVYRNEEEAKAIDEVVTGNHGVVPLCRSPALTEEEKKGIDGIIRDFQVIAEFNEERCHPHYAQKARCRVAMLSGLLKRLG
jgi:hypothetical protein